jgi:uncharacterized C2H2 Zn-finger protein
MKSILVINEKDYIEKILNDENYVLIDKPFATLKMMAQYYYEINDTRKRGLKEKLIDFLKNHYMKYQETPEKWDDICEKIARKTGGDKLIEADGIHITKTELEKILEIENLPDISTADKKALERLLFTILVLGKYQKLHGAEFNYVSSKKIPIKTIDLFHLANVKGNRSQRNQMLYKLFKMGLIGFPNSNIADNCRAIYTDDLAEAVITVTDLQAIGYQLNAWRGDSFNQCVRCKTLIKTNSGKDGYCCDCYPIRNLKLLKCEECGALFTTTSNNKTHCQSCQAKRNQQSKNESAKRKKREKEKS